MTSPTQESDPSSSREFVKQSSLYQEFLAEREEILKHKWLESERLGYDIGFERALLDSDPQAPRELAGRPPSTDQSASQSRLSVRIPVCDFRDLDQVVTQPALPTPPADDIRRFFCV